MSRLLFLGFTTEEHAMLVRQVNLVHCVFFRTTVKSVYVRTGVVVGVIFSLLWVPPPAGFPPCVLRTRSSIVAVLLPAFLLHVCHASGSIPSASRAMRNVIISAPFRARRHDVSHGRFYHLRKTDTFIEPCRVTRTASTTMDDSRSALVFREDCCTRLAGLGEDDDQTTAFRYE